MCGAPRAGQSTRIKGAKYDAADNAAAHHTCGRSTSGGDCLVFTSPSGDPADPARPRGRSTTPMDGPPPPPKAPDPLTPSQTLDAAAALMLNDAVDAAVKYIEESGGDKTCMHERRQKLARAAYDYAVVRAAADAARAASNPGGGNSGAGTGASMIAGLGAGVATGAVLAGAVHADAIDP